MTSLLLLALLAGAPDPAAWRQVVDGDVLVFARSQPG